MRLEGSGRVVYQMIPRVNETAEGVVRTEFSVDCYNISVVDWEEDGSIGSLDIYFEMITSNNCFLAQGMPSFGATITSPLFYCTTSSLPPPSSSSLLLLIPPPPPPPSNPPPPPPDAFSGLLYIITGVTISVGVVVIAAMAIVVGICCRRWSKMQGMLAVVFNMVHHIFCILSTSAPLYIRAC